jgi:hypothetical protein
MTVLEDGATIGLATFARIASQQVGESRYQGRAPMRS